MRWLGITVACVLGLSAPACAEVVVAINKSQQAMTVSINGAPTYHWTVSTGASWLRHAERHLHRAAVGESLLLQKI